MLVLSRRKNESIVVGNVTLTVVEVRGDTVRLGVTCPPDIAVHRQEVYEAIHGWSPPGPPPRPPEEAAFLQAVLENPDDDAPRLIFADWLDERGDARGEFIRIQCQLAKSSGRDPLRKRLEERERALWAEHGKTWAAYLPPVLRAATFERGFVETVQLTLVEFLGHAGQIFAAAPVRRFRARPTWLAHPSIQAAVLTHSPYLARLAELDLSGQGLGDGIAELLAASPHATSLNTLVLRDNRIQDAGAAALAASPHLADLAALDLRNNPIQEAATRALRARFGERVRV